MASIGWHRYQRTGSVRPHPLVSWLKDLVARARLWHALARERHQLKSLDAHLLRDIGISQAEAVREAYRPFWDVAGSARHRNHHECR